MRSLNNSTSYPGSVHLRGYFHEEPRKWTDPGYGVVNNSPDWHLSVAESRLISDYGHGRRMQKNYPRILQVLISSYTNNFYKTLDDSF